jgi:hypothetical protein
LGSVLGLIALGVVGSHVGERLVRWLHARPRYQATFGAIVLDPPPPAWFRGGGAVFLDRVRQAAQRGDEPFSALDLDLAELAREFRLYCWVKRVVRVERHAPNRLVVRLDYRTPVAWAPLPGKVARVLLDEDGVMLPAEDVDEEKAGLLVAIRGLEPPFEPRLGRLWLTDETSEGLGKANQGVLAAAKLAAFLKSALARESKPIPQALLPAYIHVSRRDEEKKYYIFYKNREGTLIYWDEPPGLETPGQLTAEQRWQDLHQWIKRRPAVAVPYPAYLDFTKDGVVIRGPVKGRG